jgi:hypothetical protein
MYMRAIACLILSVVLVACSSASPTVVSIPTQTLIPATITPSPVVLTATVTNTPLPRPGDLQTPSSSDPSISPTPAMDPVAAELVELARRRIAQDLDLPTARVRLIAVEDTTWSDTSLGCPLEGESYAEVEIPGYRIILGVGQDRYVFHSDFDRVIHCRSDSSAVTPEATTESTDDV